VESKGRPRHFVYPVQTKAATTETQDWGPRVLAWLGLKKRHGWC
jgi:hypothetical protein